MLLFRPLSNTVSVSLFLKTNPDGITRLRPESRGGRGFLHRDLDQALSSAVSFFLVESQLLCTYSPPDSSFLAEVFAREDLAELVGKEPLSPERAERFLSWRHTGFNVHSRVRAKTRQEAERVGKYIIRPLLSLERLSLEKVYEVAPLLCPSAAAR